MKIILFSSYVPFVNGGYRNIVDWLKLILEGKGHQVEKIYLPQSDNPGLLFQQMMAIRYVNFDMADRVICFRPQSHLVRHKHKIIWFLHHIRVFYDLWNSPYRGFPDDPKHRNIRDALHVIDSEALNEAKKIFSNSYIIKKRLLNYNKVDSEVLYPPLYQSELFHCSAFNDEIICISRVEHHKRQHLLIEALKHTKSPVRLRLIGKSSCDDYPKFLLSLISEYKLENRVVFENIWMSNEDKVNYLSNCLALAYLPLDEDSYGYPSLEASYSSKPILTTTDSGGVLELVKDGFNGYISEPSPLHLAEIMDNLYYNRKKTALMGQNAKMRMEELNISWDHVVTRLLS